MSGGGGQGGIGTSRGRSRWLLKACLTVALLYLVFSRVPVGKVVPAIRSADAGTFALACLVGMVPAFLGAMRMKRLTDRQGMSLSARMHFDINLAASFYGLFLPGFLSGGVLRWHRISRPDRNATGAAAVVVLNRFLQTTSAAASGVIFFALAGSAHGRFPVGVALVGVLTVLLAGMAVLLNERISARLGRWVEGQARIPGVVRDGLRKLVLAFQKYRGMPPGECARIAMFALAEEGIGAVSYFLVAWSVGVDIPFADLGAIRSCVAIATTIPLSIAGFGVREGSLIVLLAPYGIPAKLAVAFSLLTFARGLVFGAVGGILEARNAFSPAGRKPVAEGDAR